MVRFINGYAYKEDIVMLYVWGRLYYLNGVDILSRRYTILHEISTGSRMISLYHQMQDKELSLLKISPVSRMIYHRVLNDTLLSSKRIHPLIR